jgi:hypothetical protein
MLNLRIRDAKEGPPVKLRDRMAPAPQPKEKAPARR